MDLAYHKAYELGGVTSGEHGIGLTKRRYYLRETPKENLAAMNAHQGPRSIPGTYSTTKSLIYGGE